MTVKGVVATARLLVMAEETDSGWWRMSARPPAPPLRGLVSRYLGYREYAALPVRRREVPTGQVALIMSFGPSIRVLEPARPNTGGQSLTSFVVTVGTGWAETEYVGDQYGVQIDVTPLAAGMILGTRMGELGSEPVDLVDALGAEGRRLLERLEDSADWSRRFTLLDDFFINRLARAHAPSPAAAWAWAKLCETQGQISIAALAEQMTCSPRYLSAQVRAHVGVPPKLLARVLRVQRAIRLLGTGSLGLAQVAALCGYADQSHFGRDFLAITGASPGTWTGHTFMTPGVE